MNKSKAVYIIAVAATIVSFSILILSASEYRIALRQVEIAQALTQNADSNRLKDGSWGRTIDDLLRAKSEELESLHGALVNMVKSRQKSAAQQCFAWGMICILHLLLTGMLRPLGDRKHEL